MTRLTSLISLKTNEHMRQPKLEKYNKLTPIRHASKIDGRHVIWHFKCDCGAEKDIRLSAVESGASKSCGCLRDEVRKTHGMAKTKIYAIWRGIESRCKNKNQIAYSDYGGRGIKNEWGSFEDFYADMGPTYREGLTIDRTDNNGNYCKSNCRWTSYKEQSRNRRNNVWLEFNGERMLQDDWAEKLNISPAGLLRRLKVWPLERALTEKNGISKIGGSGLRGVYRNESKTESWLARIYLAPGKKLNLGVFESKEQAHAAYKEAALKYFGDFSSYTAKSLMQQTIRYSRWLDTP